MGRVLELKDKMLEKGTDQLDIPSLNSMKHKIFDILNSVYALHVLPKYMDDSFTCEMCRVKMRLLHDLSKSMTRDKELIQSLNKEDLEHIENAYTTELTSPKRNFTQSLPFGQKYLKTYVLILKLSILKLSILLLPIFLL